MDYIFHYLPFSRMSACISPCTYVIDNGTGYKSLHASKQLIRGEAVIPLVGQIVHGYENVPLHEKQHACQLEYNETGDWMLISSDVRYANHSCDPNCAFSGMVLVVKKDVINKDEEITFCYNACEKEDADKKFFWDERWSFECRCGASNCVQQVRGYHFYGS